MEIYNSLVQNENVSLALGFFDGVHLAHQKLIKKTSALAKTNGIKSALLTFRESPASIIFGTEPVYITPFEEKARLIEELGIDYLYVLDFNEFKSMRAEEYIKEVLIKTFCPKYIITGFNHTFGLNREGTGELLKKFNSVYNYVEIEPVSILNTLVSSTNIKKAIKEGEIEIANKMLNRNFSIKGKVVKGAQIARKLGYNTANIFWNEKIVKPGYGVYSGLVDYEGASYAALINFGIRPSVDKDLKETLEVHLIGFEGNLYDKTIEVEFSSKLRDEIKFNSLEELKNQIDKDYETLKNSPII